MAWLTSIWQKIRSPVLPGSSLSPLPTSPEDFVAELKSFENLDQDSEPPPRAKLFFNVLSSAKIKRPFESAMILLVGVSGVGKSSTINHLLDTGEGDVAVAMTSKTKSQTRKTSEYVLSFDDPSFAVCDLKLSVVDTPGFIDDEGVDQDACNFISIKRFFETHPGLPESVVYPNLVFLPVSANDNRIKGRNSSLAKCLRVIKLLEVIDVYRSNLVVLITFCCSVRHKNVEKWNKAMQEKTDVISSIVYEILGVRAPVVLIENDLDELKKDGEFTVLPNDERQPKNLYNACQELLTRNEDRFGLQVFNAAFTRPKKDLPTNGYEIEAKNSSVETLSEEEKEFSKAFSEDAKGGLDLIAAPAMDYVKENDLKNSERDEIFKIVETMKSLNLSDATRLLSVSMEEIRFAHGEDISKHGITMLEQKFGVKNESILFDSADFVGQGYNIIVDEPVAAQIMKFSGVDETKFGVKVPACAQVNKTNETREHILDFQSDQSQVESRLKNLGLNFDLAPSILRILQQTQALPKFGFSAHWMGNKENKEKKTTKSSLVEYRLLKVNIGNFETKEIKFTKDFRSAVMELPDKFTNADKQKFTRFFNRFGHCVVTSAYIGGAVEKKISHESLERLEHGKDSVDGSASANASSIGGANVSGTNQASSQNAKNAVLKNTETRWYGGRSDLHNNNTLENEKKMQEWKASLAKEPTLLRNEMTLEPISLVVGCINKTKQEACYQALRNLFDDKDLLPVRNQHDEEMKKIEDNQRRIKIDEEERCRQDSNSRTGSIKPPDAKRWWETVTGTAFTVGGTIVCIVVGLLAVILKSKS